MKRRFVYHPRPLPFAEATTNKNLCFVVPEIYVYISMCMNLCVVCMYVVKLLNPRISPF